MMIGNQNSFSDHQAKLIITSGKIPSHESLKVYTLKNILNLIRNFHHLQLEEYGQIKLVNLKAIEQKE